MKPWLFAAALGLLLSGCARSGQNSAAPAPRPTPDPRYAKGAETAASYAKIRVEKTKTRAELDTFWKNFDASLTRLQSRKKVKAQADAIKYYLQPVKDFSATRRQSLPK